jgi:hypothetical protein
MKTNESKIAFICFHLFFGNGTFQRVTADSNKKKNPSLSSLAAPISEDVFPLVSLPRGSPLRAVDLANIKLVAQFSTLCNRGSRISGEAQISFTPKDPGTRPEFRTL